MNPETSDSKTTDQSQASSTQVDGPTDPTGNNGAGERRNSVNSGRSARSAASTRRKWLIYGFASAIGIAAIVAMLRPASITAELAIVERGPLAVTVEEQGRTRAKFRYTVSAPISGRLLRTPLDEGDRVSVGDILVRIAPPPRDARLDATTRAELVAAQARQRVATARLSEATTELARAKQEAVRRESLFEKHYVSAESRDSFVQAAQAAEAGLRSARAAVAAADAEVKSAESRLLGSDTEFADEGTIAVRAPVDGVVLRVREESERVVGAGTPLFDMSDGETIELLIDLLTEDGVKVSPGDTIRVSGWGGDHELMGKVRYVEPGAFTKISALGVEEQRVYVIGDLTDPPKTLGAEFRIEASIVTWSGDALRIPTGAMFRRDNAWQVFAVEDGRARRKKIEIGHRGKEFAEVVSGLVQGDEVIVFPSDEIIEGIGVKSSVDPDNG